MRPYSRICLLLTSHTCPCLQAASAWHGVQQGEQADWCYLQLRKHLCSITAAGANPALQLDTRRALQRLQFGILTGNLGLAARQKHQVGQCLGQDSRLKQPTRRAAAHVAVV